MKKTFIAILSALAIMGCSDKDSQGYFGKAELMAENGRMSPEDMHQLGYLSDPQLSPDGTKILFGVSYTSIQKNASCRNLYICNPDGSGRVQITRYAKSVAAAKWSNDGKSIYFLQGGQLWKAPFKGTKLGKKVQLSDVPAGISDYSISPDESAIYYVSSTPGPVKDPQYFHSDLDKAKAYTTDQMMFRHWDHWVTETPRTFVSKLCGEMITPANSKDILYGQNPYYELPTEPFGGAEQLCWSPDSKYIAYSVRKKTGIEYAFSTNTDIYLYEVATGKEEAVTCVGGYDTDPVWSPDGKSLAWISMERDGYEADKQRLMVADINNGVPGTIRELAGALDADVSGILWNGTDIIFPATVDGIQALFKVNSVGEPSIKRLTPDWWWFNFGLPFSYTETPEGTEILTTYQSNLFPTEMVKICIDADGNAEYGQISSENSAYFASAGEIRQERIILESPDGGDLQCWVLYPADFDQSKKWPVIEMFNGGPQSCLDQAWSKRWNFGLMAHQGYVVVLPNRHGCSGFGQAWKEQISGDYQGLNMQDYMIAGRWAKEQSWCGKLAGVGASYGGFSVYNMMGLHGDLYDCFISHCGIFNEKMMWYTTEEAWFGNWDNGGLTEYAYEAGQTGPKGDGITFGGMQQAGAPYAKGAKVREHYDNDPEAKVTKWHTPLLCIHGMMDFRIPYEQGMAAFNAAQMMGVPSRLVIFPEECHWVQQPQNCIYWQREFFGWLEQWIR